MWQAERLHRFLRLALDPEVEDLRLRIGAEAADEDEVAGVAPLRQPGHLEHQVVVHRSKGRLAARQDLIRMTTELREEIESEGHTIRGGIYVSCVARGEALFGDAGLEMDLIKANLGEFPLVGFYANGEIARDTLYGYTGVLTLFI